MITVEITGIEQVEKVLGTNLEPALRGATKAVAAVIQNEIAPYPKATSANRPAGPGSRWYERGYGPRWMLVGGGIHGRKTSQQLGRRWAIKSQGRMGAVLGNIASYAAFVHSKKKQAGFHADRGWVTDVEAIDRVRKRGLIQRIVGDAIMHAMRQR